MPTLLRPVVPRLGTANAILRDYHDVLEHLLGGGYMTNAGEFSAAHSTDHPPIRTDRVDPDLTYAVVAAVLSAPGGRSLPVVLESLRMAALALDAGWQAVENEFGDDA